MNDNKNNHSLTQKEGNLETLLEKMWQDYIALNPQAQKIHRLFLDAEGTKEILNDHIALRTFQEPSVGIDVLAAPFVQWGYEAKGEYFFKQKNLYARHYEHKMDSKKPKIFISELETKKFSKGLQEKVVALLNQVPNSEWKRWDLSCIGRPWILSYDIYLDLLKESEYAAWMVAFGFRPNHFTVDVNDLKTFQSLEKVNTFLKKQGYHLNTAGGEIKGSPADLLEQSSTLAEKVKVSFTDGTKTLPACYYEFAKRYHRKGERLYQGFIAQSADKIFESTDTTQLEAKRDKTTDKSSTTTQKSDK